MGPRACRLSWQGEVEYGGGGARDALGFGSFRGPAGNLLTRPTHWILNNSFFKNLTKWMQCPNVRNRTLRNLRLAGSWRLHHEANPWRPRSHSQLCSNFPNSPLVDRFKIGCKFCYIFLIKNTDTANDESRSLASTQEIRDPWALLGPCRILVPSGRSVRNTYTSKTDRFMTHIKKQWKSLNFNTNHWTSSTLTEKRW